MFFAEIVQSHPSSGTACIRYFCALYCINDILNQPVLSSELYISINDSYFLGPFVQAITLFLTHLPRTPWYLHNAN